MSDGPILVISGTNRPGSHTAKIARVVLEHYQRQNVAAELYDLCDMPREVFDPKCYEHKPRAWQVVQKRIVDAAGLHMVTPEYNGSFPGVLKYFIDMLKFPESFERKPVAFVGLAAGLFGALRSVEQLQMIFMYRNACIYPERVFIPGVRQRFADHLLIDQEINQRLGAQVGGFSTMVRKLHGT